MAELLKQINNVKKHPLDNYPEFKKFVCNKSKQDILDNVYIIPKCPHEYGFISKYESNCWNTTCSECYAERLKDINW